MKRLAIAGAAMLAMAGTALATAIPPNEQLVIDFFNFSGTRAERAGKMLTPDYVQHNPRFLVWGERLGVRGSDAWVKVLPDAAVKGVRLVELGGIPLRRPIIVMVEGDLVHAVYRGRIADSGQPGRSYEAFAFEAFRIKGGRFAEHWDQVRLAPGWTAPGPAPPAAPVEEGPPPVPQPSADCKAAPAELARNKRVVLSFFDGAPKPALLASSYIEHSPRLAKALPASAAVRAPALVIADCDYVAVVWKQALPDPDRPGATYEAFSFDTFRVKDGLLAEHWDGATL